MKRSLLLLALILVGCGSASVDPFLGPAGGSEANPRAGRGGLATRAEDLAQVPKALDPALLQETVKAKAALPDSFSLDPSKLAPVLNQGSLESCGAFGLAYETCGFATGLDLSDPANCISPAYMYKVVLQTEHHTAAKDSSGTYAKDYYSHLVKSGSATLASCPYPGGHFTQMAQAIDTLDPSKFTADNRLTIGHWAYIPKYNDEDTLKQFVSSGQPVGILVELASNFDNFYNNSGVFVAAGAHNAGGHFMCLVGYDDNRQAFRIQNSWGSTFGDQGFFWWDYASFLTSVVEAHVAYPVQDAPVSASGGSFSSISGGTAFGAKVISAFQSHQASGQVHLVLRLHFDEPLKLLAVHLRGPSGPVAVHRPGEFLRSGKIYLTRADGKQWPAGKYSVKLEVERVDGQTEELRAEVHLGLVTDGSPLPVGEHTQLTGSNGQPAEMTP